MVRLPKKEIKIIPVDTAEVTSFTGDIAWFKGSPVAHRHISAALRDGSVKGGHLLELVSGPKILTTPDFFDRHIRLTCDIPMKNLLVELLVGLYGFPYIANAEKSLAIKYKAKETWMFSNVFIFDQYRYLYDFLPAIDLFEDFFSNISNQIIVRACMDTIHRRHFKYNRDLFKWSFIEDLYGEFGYSELAKRMNLNEIV